MFDQDPPTEQAIADVETLLQQFREHPETWDQHVWAVFDREGELNAYEEYRDDTTHTSPATAEQLNCGSAGCIAGWYAKLRGVPVYFARMNRAFAHVLLPGGQTQMLGDWASEQLGLPPFSAHYGRHMFDDYNSLGELERWLEFMKLAREQNCSVYEVFRREREAQLVADELEEQP